MVATVVMAVTAAAMICLVLLMTIIAVWTDVMDGHVVQLKGFFLLTF